MSSGVVLVDNALISNLLPADNSSAPRTQQRFDWQSKEKVETVDSNFAF